MGKVVSRLVREKFGKKYIVCGRDLMGDGIKELREMVNEK